MSPGSASSSISSLAVFNNALYFCGSGTTNGTIDLQLWKYDGTSVTKITEINPAGGGFNPSGMTVYNNALYFSANDGTNGMELWKYDGSNVSLGADINPGSGSSNPSSFCVFNGSLYFAASNSIYGNELWKFDGANATLALDLNSGSASSNPSGMIVFRDFAGNNALLFQATTPSSGAELWFFNGVQYGLVGDINPLSGSSNPANFVVFNDMLYFSANDGSNGTELWEYNGPNYPVRVTQIAPGSSSSNPANPCVYNGALYFSANDGSSGTELWKYDGTNATRVADIYPGSGSSLPSSLAVFNGALYFGAMSASSSRALWKYDGSAVSLVTNVNTGSAGSLPYDGIAFNGAYYFAASSSNGTGTVFYKYDGTNTSVVSTTIYPAGGSGIVAFNGALYFSTWKFDGTNFTALNGNPLPTSVSSQCVFSNAIYFSGRDNTYSSQLWKCDGTNMTRLTTVNPSYGLNPLSLVVFNNALYFFATTDYGVTYGLWKYDGVNAPERVGTMILNSLNNLLVYNGALYMGAATSGTDFEPWKYDGTNFTFLGEVNAFGTNATPVFWTACQNRAFFSANDGVHGTNGGYQLWSCDGTNLTRLSNFAVSGGIYAFALNDALYFMANDGITGYELWKYDGTTVSQVADINPGYYGSQPQPLSAFGNSYMFQANDALHGAELSSVFCITQIARQGNDVSVTWITPGGWTNVVQVANGLGGTNNFSDRSSSILAVNGDIVTTNYLDVGGAINHPSRFYRIRLGP